MKHSMKIMHIISTLDIGGAEQNLFYLVSRMEKRSFLNHVVSMTDIGPTGKMIQETGIPVTQLDMRKGVPDPRGIVRMRRVVQKVKPDIIQSWMYHANLFGLLFNQGRHLFWNIRCSDMDLEKYGFMYKISVHAGALLSRIPAIVITNSYAGRSTHESLGYRPRRWEVIPNGFDLDLFKPDPEAKTSVRYELGIPQNALVIGLIARFDPMKDHLNFLAGARILHDTYPDTHFLLAGRGVDERNPDFEHIVRNMPWPNHFHLLGERLDIPRILAALDISASSSYGEGIPNNIGESMAAGIPCVVTDAGDSRNLIGETGIVVPRQDPHALAHAWTELIQAGAESRKEIGQRARDRIRGHYNIKATVGNYESLYSAFKER